MANSSDWLGALSGLHDAGPQFAQPGWLAQLVEPGGFRERAALFAAPATETSARQPLSPAPDPAPDPVQDAIARAYAEGEAAGRAAAQAAADAAATRQRALRLAFRTLDEAARDVLADDLAATVAALCDGAMGACAIDRDALLARCHAAATRIGGAAAALTLHLHPDDLALLGADAVGGWRTVPDPALERGSVLIEGADGAVTDGPAEWRRAIAAGLRG